MREYLYIWIKKWVWLGNGRYLFENIGIPLQSKYSVKFDCKRTVIDIERNKNYNINYFSEIISDLVAVVGNNGAGKSSLLELLKLISTKGFADMAKDYKLIYIDYENNDGDVVDVILRDGNTNREQYYTWHIKNDEPRIKIKKNNLVDKEDGGYSLEYKSDFVIFYAPFFADETSEHLFGSEGDWLGSTDISTKKLINVYSHKLHNPGLQHRNSFDRLDSYSLYEQQIEMEFVADFLSELDDSPMELPKYMYIQNNIYPVILVLDELKKENTMDDIDNRENMINFIERWKEMKDLRSKIYLSAFACLYKSKNRLNRHLFADITEKTNIESVIVDLNEITDGTLQKLINLIESTAMLLDDGRYLIYIAEKKDELKKIMNYHYELKNRYLLSVPILLIKRQRLSSGENNFIQLFARFYNVWKTSPKQNGSVFEADNILFLIDEGEANFHPEWQRRYIKILIHWVELIMKKLEKDNVIEKIPMFQIILSTHSPFVACDLPVRNLIRLRRELCNNVNVTELVESENKNSGIGAYVTDLLKGEFFIKSLLGELAEDRINALIEEMRGKGTLSAKSKFVLEGLGDKFLKNFLGSPK